MKRLLIIDDERDLGELLKRALKNRGAFTEILCVSTYRDALSKWSFWNPGLVLLDINLGQANGLDLLTEHELPETSVIAMSAHADFASEALRKGASKFIQKPFRINELADIISQLRAA